MYVPAINIVGKGVVGSSSLVKVLISADYATSMKTPGATCVNPRETSAICKLFHPQESVSFKGYSSLMCLDNFVYPLLG